MFEIANVKARIVKMGFGPLIADVLCDWYEESKRLNAEGTEPGDMPLYEAIDLFVEDDGDLAVFIIDNFFSTDCRVSISEKGSWSLWPEKLKMDRVFAAHDINFVF